MVLIAATHHGHRRPDSDVADNTIRAVRLTLQQQDPDSEATSPSFDGDDADAAVVEEPEPPSH